MSSAALGPVARRPVQTTRVDALGLARHGAPVGVEQVARDDDNVAPLVVGDQIQVLQTEDDVFALDARQLANLADANVRPVFAGRRSKPNQQFQDGLRPVAPIGQ